MLTKLNVLNLIFYIERPIGTSYESYFVLRIILYVYDVHYTYTVRRSSISDNTIFIMFTMY